MQGLHICVPHGVLITPILFEKYDGVRFISDVHGEFDALSEVLIRANNDNMFPVSLGDLVDRGPDSASCLSVFLNLMERGQGFMIPGNHELKQWKKMNGHTNIRWLDDHQRTYDQIAQLPEDDIRKFIRMMQSEIIWGRVGDLWFSHAAWSPLMEQSFKRSLTPGEIKDLKQHSYYGHLPSRRVFDPDYDVWEGLEWINEVPEGHSMVVGHTIMDRENPAIVDVQGHAGGQAIMLDTGCGSVANGYISTLDYMADGTIDYNKSIS